VGGYKIRDREITRSPSWGSEGEGRSRKWVEEWGG